MRLVTATVAALLVIGFAATLAQGSTGDPVVLGQDDNGGHHTTSITANTSDAFEEHGGPALTVLQNGIADDPNQSAILAQETRSQVAPAITAVGNYALRAKGDVDVLGALRLQNATSVIVKPGARTVTAKVTGTMAVAELQEQRPNLWVTATVPDPQDGIVTVHLNRPVAHPVGVAVVALG
jgi:hypothetical protein